MWLLISPRPSGGGRRCSRTTASRAEVDGLVALEARKAAPRWWTRLLGGAPTNRVEYANELEPRVGALRSCAADGGCADPRECGGLCARARASQGGGEEIEDADE